MSERAVDSIMNNYWAFRPSQPPRLPEPAEHQPAASVTQSGQPAPPIAQPDLLAGVATAAPDGRGAATAHQLPSPSSPPAQAAPPPIPATRPLPPSSPRQSDVDMIGGLIKKMADEINAVEADRLRNPAGGGRVPPAAIEASVNALRTTADQMRGATAMAPAHEAARATAKQAAPPHDAAFSGEPIKPFPRARVAEPPTARAEAVAGQRLDSVVPPPLPAPPPLPSRQSEPVSPPPATRHAMDRPAARALPPRDETGGYAPMPWPDQTDRPDLEDTYVDVRGHGALSASEIMVPEAVPQQPTPVVHSRLAALAEAITAGRLDVLLDPILGLADQRARHFEVSVRLKDKTGNVLEPPDGVPELRESGLLPLLDCARIQRSAQVASRLADRGKPGSLFSAFSGESLGNDQFLSDFADLYSAREGLSGQLVLSFGQADVRAFAGRDWDTITEMHELGFRFALQSVTDLDFDLEALKAAGFDFVKLDASVFLDGMPASGGVIPAADICRHLAQLGMTLIVGQIDDEAQLARIFGFGVIYGQGQLFGGARPMKSEALADGGAGHAAA